jgi:hypothetical protein
MEVKEDAMERIKEGERRYSPDLPEDAENLNPDEKNVDETVAEYLKDPEPPFHPGVKGKAQGNPTRQNEGLSGVTTHGLE